MKALWEKIAAGRPEFGRPSTFGDHIEESKWVLFTTTLHDPTFFRLIRDFTGNVPGEGGLITLANSNWLASIVLPHQPHFIGQPKDVDVFWGYGLFVDKLGDFTKKPMHTCTGREIMTEIMGHLRIEAEALQILETSTCIPCMMPFITSRFLRIRVQNCFQNRERTLNRVSEFKRTESPHSRSAYATAQYNGTSRSWQNHALENCKLAQTDHSVA